ncbi:MAG: hypothetical protein FJ295_05950 [Planctomycetes bacterium]|nr:hypothetical protein [Planctomycetota bacterium]
MSANDLGNTAAQLPFWALLTFAVAVPHGTFAEEVVATVNGQAIAASEVERGLAAILKNRTLTPEQSATLRGEMLQRLIDRQLIAQALTAEKQWVSNQDLDLAVDRLTERLARSNESLEKFMARHHLDRSALRRQLAWEEGWGRYLASRITDATMEKYFEDHRREYDGTRLRVGQILFPVQAGDAEALEKQLPAARKVLEELRQQRIAFDEAAMRYSTGPAARVGGDLGYIGRHEPMPEEFGKAAFALEKGAISEPVVTPIGVHLIRWTDSKPGIKTWFDAREQLQQDMELLLFERLAQKARKGAKIELKQEAGKSP